MKNNAITKPGQDWTLLDPSSGRRSFTVEHTKFTKKEYFKFEPQADRWEVDTEAVDELVEMRVESILKWFADLGLTKLYIEYQTHSPQIANSLPERGWVEWSSDMIKTLPLCNVDVVCMKNEAGNELVASESWEYIFISPGLTIPENFLSPVTET